MLLIAWSSLWQVILAQQYKYHQGGERQPSLKAYELCYFQTNLPHCRFDGDFCATVQAPLPQREDPVVSVKITSPLYPKRKTTDSWLLFNLRAMPRGEKAKAAWPLHGCLKRLFISFLTKLSYFTSQNVGNPVQIIKYVELLRFHNIQKL